MINKKETKIVPYKQNLSHGCLAASLLMLWNSKKGKLPVRKNEELILFKGMDRKYEFYVTGLCEEFVNLANLKLSVYVNNNYFKNVLKKYFKNKNVTVLYKKIDLLTIQDLLKKGPLILHIDDNALGDYSHASHFIFIYGFSGNFFNVIDPWDGKIKRISKTKMLNAIKLLRTHIKMCPLIIQ